MIKAARLKTGGGIVEEKALTPLEERILLLIGLDAADGLNIDESEDLPDEYIIPSMEAHEFQSLMSAEQQELFFQTLHASVENDPSSQHETLPETPQATPQSNDVRAQSLKCRRRVKPIVLKSEHTKKIVDGHAEMASALKRCAETLERRTDLIEQALEIKKHKLALQERAVHLEEQKLNLQEKSLLIEKQKADAFSAITEILKNKM
ncbi:unnamed protein product [Larinioides sclopetarius]